MIRMKHQVAIVGSGVSGLTCGLVFAEHGYRTAIFAKEIGQQTTSGAAAAVWFPYHAEPAKKVIPWALATYKALADLARMPASGVSMIELRQFSRTGEIQIPDWAISLGASAILSPPSVMSSGVETSLALVPSPFASGFSLRVPLTDTTIYLHYLATRFWKTSGESPANGHFEYLKD